MRKLTKRIVSIALAALMILSVLSMVAVAAPAELALAPIFSQNAVLQRNEPLNIFGTGAPGDNVTVSIGGNSASVKVDAKGNWEVELPAMEAGGPYTLKAVGDRSTVTATDVLIGEVWVMAGQSNMEWNVNLSIDEITYKTLQNFDYPNIRLYVQPVYEGFAPAEWTVATSYATPFGNTMPWWSVLSVLYAKQLYAELGYKVPIGIVQAALGNTPIQSFMTDEMMGDEREHAAAADMEIYKNGYMYNNFVAPYDRMNIAGVVFYQGESNTQTHDNEVYRYGTLLKKFIEGWRAKFGEDTPFIINSVATWYNYDPNEFTGGQLINIQVAETLKDIPNTALINNIDVRSGNNIHPTFKSITANRCVKAAMAMCYGGTDPYLNPAYKSHTVKKGEVIVTFDNAKRGLKKLGDYAAIENVLGFQIAGDNKVFYNADAEIYQGSKIKLSSKSVPEPKYVRYAYGASPQVNLYNYEGFPLVQFDTSDFEGSASSQKLPIYDFPDPTPGRGESILKFTPEKGVNIQANSTRSDTNLFFSWDEFGTSGGGRHIQQFVIDGIPEYCTITKVTLRGFTPYDIMAMEGSAGFIAYDVTGNVDYNTVTRDTMPAETNQVADGTVYGNLHNGYYYDVEFDPAFITGNGTYDIMYKTTGTTHMNYATNLSNICLYVSYKVKTPNELVLVSGPDKTEYAPGEKFDPTGMVINAVYDDGTVQASNFTYSITKFQKGDDEIKVYYGSKSVTIPITVVERNVTAIEVTKMPEKVKYVAGEIFDPTGAQLTVTYSDKTTETVDITENMCLAVDMSADGIKTVTVSYEGFTDTFDITVGDVTPPPAEPEFVLGDADEDGKISITDALEIFKILAGKITAPEKGSVAFLSADCNGDGGITITDALAIFKHLAGKELLG